MRLQAAAQLSYALNRHVIKEGDVYHLWRENTGAAHLKSSMVIDFMLGRGSSGHVERRRNRRVHLILFTDYLLITKYRKKADEYIVLDYCSRQFVDIAPMDLTCVQVNLADLWIIWNLSLAAGESTGRGQVARSAIAPSAFVPVHTHAKRSQ